MGGFLSLDSWVAAGNEEITEKVPLWECRGGPVLLVKVYLVYVWRCVAMSLQSSDNLEFRSLKSVSLLWEGGTLGRMGLPILLHWRVGWPKSSLRLWYIGRNIVLGLKPETYLAELVMAWGLGMGEAVASDYENPAIVIVQGYGYQSKAPVFLICDVLEIHCVPFVQHCLISFPLTSYFLVENLYIRSCIS